ncbi:tape measure protein [Mycobacterium phage IdentityCrisis]|uniref:Tape measure protein n=1 Tax=Mycobacterium phage IdentityCrisis TaxID=2599866 RepID=A0A5J6TH84_9CAUD|nr:tape measure protein [Mycobacterium phage IdentityCrisis]QFG10035.1 tape measure protein [Mycobacterium phage IdentityCrisis]
MTTIGYATLQIIPSLRGVSDAINKESRNLTLTPKVQVDATAANRAGQQVGKAVADGAEGATGRMADIGRRMSSALGTAVKGAAIGAVGGLSAVLASTLSSGFDRLKSIDATQAKLLGLGNSAETVKKIMENATAAVKGTAFGLGEAGTVAASAVAAGVKPGAELERTLKLVADASAIAGTSMGDMGAIFNKVAAGGVIQGEELAQLGDRGIPILQLLSTQLGVSVADVRKLASEGKIGFAEFQNAIESGMGGAAQKMGTTFEGSMGNLRAAMGRLGEKLLKPLFDAMIEAAPKITAAFDTVTRNLGGIGDFVSRNETAIKGVGIAITTFVVPALLAWTAAQAKAIAASVVSAIASIASSWRTVGTALRLGAAAQWAMNVAMNANPIGLIVTAVAALVTGLVLFFTKTELGQRIWKGFTEYLSVAWEAVKVAFAAAWDFIRTIWDAMVAKAGEVWQGVQARFTAIVDFVKGLPGRIGDAAKGMWDGIGNAFKAMVNGLISVWNRFASSLSFSPPDWVPGIGGKTFSLPTIQPFSGGGYTGDLPIDRIAGVVHGGEHVIQAASRKRIEADHPGLLDYMNATGRLPGYAGGGLVAGTAELRKIIAERFGISNIGGWRPQDQYGEHSTGRALDVMVGDDRAKGDAVKDFALANASAIDLKWVIWRQRLYYPGGGGYDMEDRGSPTANHMDHVHIFSGPAIAAGLRDALRSKEAEPATSSSPGVIDPNSTDQTSAQAADVAPVAATSGAVTGGDGASLPSSVSELAGYGGQAIGGDVGSAVGEIAAGQVRSALGVFGVPDSPGWLQGISKFVGGLSISDAQGNNIFGGGGGASSAIGGMGSLFGGGQDDGYGGAAPVAASSPAPPRAPDGGIAHGTQAGQRPGPPAPVYNIRTATVEDAFLQAQRRENVRLASKVDRY